MAVEIERKFLVVSDAWRLDARPGRQFCQGYVARTPRGTVRVRRIGATASLAIKSRRKGLSRQEFEYPIPVAEAEAMLREVCGQPLIEKTRYEVRHAGLLWEVDVFDGAAEGLVLAEVELAAEDQLVELPRWVGAEVTQDPRYRGSSIGTGEWRTALLPRPIAGGAELEAR